MRPVEGDVTIGYYIIPMVAGPYSRANPQRPMFVDEIRCNWSGHPVDALGVYVCKINTTEAKHSNLDGRTGVRSFPRNVTWDTVIATLPAVARNRISAWCTSKAVPRYDSAETIGQLLQRVISGGLLDLHGQTLTTQFQSLSGERQQRIRDLCQRFRRSEPASTETVRQIVNRLGNDVWPANDATRVHVEEF